MGIGQKAPGESGERAIPNLEQLMQLGIQTARQGNKQNARVIFQQVLDFDKQNERAWLWMAAVAETPADRYRYLKTVLSINPRNPTALRELGRERKRQESDTGQVLLYGGIGLGLILVLVVVVLIVVFVIA